MVNTLRHAGNLRAIVPARIAEPAIWREQPTGYIVPAAKMVLPGRELLESLEGVPPLAHLTGIARTGVGDGWADFSLPVTPWLSGTAGTVLGGPVAIIADAALGCAIQTVLPRRTAYTMIEVALTYIRPVAVGDVLRAHGTLVHAGTTLGVAAVEVRDSDDALVAHGACRAAIMRSPSKAGEISVSDESADYVRPHLRPVVSDQAGMRPAHLITGLDWLQAIVGGALPLPPIHHLLGLTMVDVAADTVAVSMPMTPWLSTPWGWPQRGFIALLADAALTSAESTRMTARWRAQPIDVKVSYLRPVPADIGWLTAYASIVHSGRSLIISEAQVVDETGNVVAMATGSAMLLPRERPEGGS